ncbi:hypothetical protein [Xanthomonas nasturtii]|uniref:hypothetical protein n=2 Tax=Xanthomonas nasturtii TaxID=1843581 RepID=UPI000B2D1FF5|nr:hypothetical protein [Xanthomonas nasturtii]WVL58852.1 hypothetical protein M3O54_020440 [Xanthomonas nasturtii]
MNRPWRLDGSIHAANGPAIGKGLAANAKTSSARCPHRSRDTPLTRPWRLDGSIHAANGPAIGEDTAPDSWLVASFEELNQRTRRFADDFIEE